MTVDRLAQTASAQLRAAVEREVDPMSMLQDLQVRRARRRTVMAASGVVVVTAVAAILALTSPWRDDAAPVPAKSPTTTTAPRPPGDELVAQRLDNGVISLAGLRAPLPHTPQTIRDVGGLGALGFSADGDRLAYTTLGGVRAGGGRADGEVHVFDLPAGSDRLLGTCDHPCPVAWGPGDKGVLTVEDGALVRLSVSGGSEPPEPLPDAWAVTSLDVGPSGRVVAAGRAEDRAALMTISSEGSGPSILLDLGATAEVSDARWSPDGRTVAFVHRDTAGDDSTAEAGFSVRVVGASGAGVRSLAPVGRCQCVGMGPSLAWAPDGRLAVSTPLIETQHLYVVGPDGGLDPMDGDAIGPIAWRPGP